VLASPTARRLAQRNYKAYLDKLVAQAVEGNAWHADHIVPVYQVGTRLCVWVGLAQVAGSLVQ